MPAESVAGVGRAETVPIVKEDRDTNPGNPTPVTTMVSPEAALEGDTVTVAQREGLQDC